MTNKNLFTSESVSEGHPDKIADQIADTILDEALRQDKNSRVAVEVAVANGLVFVFGEMTTEAYVDVQGVVRDTLKKIGYSAKFGLDPDTIGVMVSINKQSENIASGVDHASDDDQTLGAGDQGLIFGYATNETANYMPASVDYANLLISRLQQVRHEGVIDYLGPDAKSQVTLEYDDSGNVKRIDTILISTQHLATVNLDTLRTDLEHEVIYQAGLPTELFQNTRLLVNPAGAFIIGGPQGDSGLTGRKLMVDTYGGRGHHGGGSMIGKDPTKVDRSAAYMARYIAKNIVASGVAEQAEVQLSYAIGMAQPISVHIEARNSKLGDRVLENLVINNFDLTPAGIIKQFDLTTPQYAQLAVGGQFGRELDHGALWERVDKVDVFKNALKG